MPPRLAVIAAEVNESVTLALALLKKVQQNHTFKKSVAKSHF
jgi:hypothetical protein